MNWGAAWIWERRETPGYWARRLLGVQTPSSQRVEGTLGLNSWFFRKEKPEGSDA